MTRQGRFHLSTRTWITRIHNRNALERHFLRTGFNLLPYRAIQARIRKRHHCSELLYAAVAGFTLASVTGYSAAREMERAAQQKKVLEQKLAVLQPALVRHEQEKARMQALAAVYLQRSALTELLTSLARATAPDVQLTELNYEAGAGLLTGVASTAQALGHWLEALKRTPCFSEVELLHLQRRTESDAANLSFQVRVKWVQPMQTSGRNPTTIRPLQQQGRP